MEKWVHGVDPTDGLADADLAITDGWDQLDAGFFPSRWERATPTERAYLDAMAGLVRTAHPRTLGSGTGATPGNDTAAIARAASPHSCPRRRRRPASPAASSSTRV